MILFLKHICILSVSISCTIKAYSGVGQLKMTDVKHSQISKVRHIGYFQKIGKKIVSFPNRGDFFLNTNYRADAPKKTLGFSKLEGDISDSMRNSLPKIMSRVAVRGYRESSRDSILILDGIGLKMYALDNTDLSFISQHDIVADRIRPAADSRGEPLTNEIFSFRQQFIKSFNSVAPNKVKFNSMRLIPSRWKRGRSQYIVSTNIPGFPLLTIHCSSKNLTNCTIDRGCFVDGMRSFKNKDKSLNLRGLGISEKRKSLVLADAEKNELLLMRYHSCHHIALLRKIKLPKELKPVTGVMVDKNENLWISTSDYDLKTDSSLYVWPATKW